MADIQPFAGMSQEETNQTMLMLLAMIVEKLPRIDNNDRLVITNSEAGAHQVTIANSQTLANVTTLQNLGVVNGYSPAGMIPLNMSNIGALHLYDNIVVS